MPLGYDLIILNTPGPLAEAWEKVGAFEQGSEAVLDVLPIPTEALKAELAEALNLQSVPMNCKAKAETLGISEDRASLVFGGWILNTPEDQGLCYQITLSAWCGRIRFLSWGLSEADDWLLKADWTKIVRICAQQGLRIYDPLYKREAGDAYAGFIAKSIQSNLASFELKRGKTVPVEPS